MKYKSMMSQEIEIEAAEAIRKSFSEQGFLKMTGSSIRKIESGYVEIEMPRADYLTRSTGIFHGGMVAMLVDCSAGYAAATVAGGEYNLLTVELKVNYLRKAEGVKLIGVGKVVKPGRTLIISQADIYAVSADDERTHVATSLATMMQV